MALLLLDLIGSCQFLTAAPALYRSILALLLQHAGSHVGISGRTGAGKSSLVAALLRLAPISGGRVTIDGRDTATLSPSQLRHAIGIEARLLACLSADPA